MSRSSDNSGCSEPLRVPRSGLFRARDARTVKYSRNGLCCSLPVLISSAVLRSRISRLAGQIAEESRIAGYDGIDLLAVMKGADVFARELAKQILAQDGPSVSLHHISISSYGKGTRSSGNIRISGRLPSPRSGNLIVVEDIVDSGRTIAALKRLMSGKAGARALKVCALMNKQSRRLRKLVNISKPDYAGFEIPDVFVVGFGLDYGELFRELPCVAAIDGRLKEIDESIASMV